MRDLAFAMIWTVLFPVALWSAHIGVLLWIWVALLSPNEQLYGFLSGVPFNKVVAAVTVVVLFLSRQKKFFYADTIIVSMVLLAVIASISTALALVPTDDGIDLYQKILKEFALVILITGVMYSRHRIHMTVLAFCIALGFTSVVEGLEYIVSGGGHKILGSFAIGDNNSIALAVLMTIPLLSYLMTYSQVKIVKNVLLVVIIISVITVIGTFSRGGFAGLVILGAFLVQRSRNKLASLSLAAVAVIGILIAAPATWFDRINSISDAGENTSFLGRVVAWKYSTLMAMDSPLWGAGPHAVQRYPVYQKYLNDVQRWDLLPSAQPDGFPHAAHSIYFEVLGDFGFAGLGLFLLILVMSLVYCHIVIRRSKANASLVWAADLARMLQVTIIVYMAAGALLSNAYFEGYWIIVAIVSRLHRITSSGVGLLEAKTVAEVAALQRREPADRIPARIGAVP